MSRSDGLPLNISFAPVEHRTAVLDLVLSGLPLADHRQHIQELAAAAQAGQVPLDGLIEARRGRQLVGAVWAQVQVGGAAGLWPPVFTADEPEATAHALLAAAVEYLSSRRVTVAQTLLKPGDTIAARHFQAFGFERAADLIYLLSLEHRFPSSSPASPLEFERYQAASHARLVGIVERTYEQTLDCPRLNGLRRTADVIDEYRATGAFEPALWMLVRHAGHDVGCLLLADHPSVPQWELVYMGLAPEVRGRGWGQAMVRHAQWLARCAARPRLVLAVDRANLPALNAYTEAGFIAWDERGVWLKFFGKAES